MTRHADPEGIDKACGAALRNRLLSDETTEQWLTWWEIEAAMRGIPMTGDFWTVADAWIAEERAARRRPWAR
jgi:hypothetical protein